MVDNGARGVRMSTSAPRKFDLHAHDFAMNALRKYIKVTTRSTANRCSTVVVSYRGWSLVG